MAEHRSLYRMTALIGAVCVALASAARHFTESIRYVFEATVSFAFACIPYLRERQSFDIGAVLGLSLVQALTAFYEVQRSRAVAFMQAFLQRADPDDDEDPELTLA